jgi:hypothetical protein
MSEDISRFSGDLERQKIAFRLHPVSHSLYWLLGLFAAFGFFYNFAQNNNRLFSLPWFVDVVILSWTNLLVVPLIIFTIIFGIRTKNFQKFFYSISLFLTSPFLLIIGMVVIKFGIKIVEIIFQGLSNFLNWIAS